MFVGDFHVFSSELEFLITSLGFVWTIIVLANVTQKVASNLVLDGVVVLSIDNKPWNKVVWWVELFSLETNFVF